MKSIRKRLKIVATFLLANFLFQVVMTGNVYAITGHNGMPEYRSFEPVSTTNMVNPLNGDFTYNIALMDIPNGYPINLSYHSGDITTEAQASWVGLGFTLNPGAINRNKRGIADDVNGENVTYHSKMPANWTATLGAGPSVEAFGFNASLTGSLKFNNYKGFGRMVNGQIGYGGIGLGFSYEAGRYKFSPSVNPIALAKKIKSGFFKNSKKNTMETPIVMLSTIEQLQQVQKTYDTKSKPTTNFLKSLTSFSVNPLQPVSIQTSTPNYAGFTVNLSFEAGTDLIPLPVDVSGRVNGSFSIQNYEPFVVKPVYGYFNSENKTSNGIMDYYNENENLFEKRDRYLGLPIPSNDVFSLTGEALSGSFKGLRSEIGHYTKDEVSSSTINTQAGFDMALPSIATFPPGVLSIVQTYGGNVGGGYSNSKVSDWSDYKGNSTNYKYNNSSSFESTTNEKITFRFSGDKSGNFSQTGNEGDEAVQAGLNSKSAGLAYELNLPFASLQTKEYKNNRAPRTSYISYTPNRDFFKNSNGKSYLSHQKNLFVLNAETIIQSASGSKYDDDENWFNYNNPGLLSNKYYRQENDKIGEITTYNASGIKYVYGLPLNVYNETDLQYSLYNSGDAKFSFPSYGTTKQNLVAEVQAGFDTQDTDYKTGVENNIQYGSQYLLTQITSPDYLDITYNGLTPDDFGSYTRFNYKKTAGYTNNYKYRTPYKGVHFSFGSLSDNRDDKGVYSAGEKDLYYIHSISSKTHVAVFTTSDRLDGYGANKDIFGDNSDDNLSLQKLEKIELYSISDCDEIGTTGVFRPKINVNPIKTVHFEYDYSLCQNLPNNISTNTGSKGKLTLKKIWFEYEGKVKNMISPYEFSYSYPTSGTYPSVYTNLHNGFSSLSSSAQNPDYNVLNTDAWGYYKSFESQYNHLAGSDANLGESQKRLSYFFPFVDQKPDASVDPAAWCLKQIKLPSGGQIHVQYEKHDYQYVQDKRAMLMVPLDNATGEDENDDTRTYILDLAKTGILEKYNINLSANPISTEDYNKLEKISNEMFEPYLAEKEGNRIYFKFLYRLIGDGGAPNYTTQNAEYIEGYARIQSFGVRNDGKIVFSFSDQADASKYKYTIDHGKNIKEIEFPRNVCKQFYKNNRQGLISTSTNGLADNPKSQGFLDALLSRLQQVTGITTVCAHMSPSMSFVKIQLPKGLSKIGGGIRVKRILTYDDGLSGDKVLFGQEYKYINSDGLSSGVATNEPEAIRRENPLVYPLDKDNQSWLDAAMYGDDMYDNEAPLGGSLLPGPSVSYSRVEIRNIHDNKATSQGYEVQEFFTCKDFPFIAKSTSVTKRLENSLGGFLDWGFYKRCTPFVTQGYSFISNDMHGKPKRIAKYAENTTTPIFEQIFEYTKPGEAVALMDKNNTISYEIIGKEAETLAERREVSETSLNTTIGMDYTFGAWFCFIGIGVIPIPIGYVSGVSGDCQGSEQILRTHVTTKIINYTAIPKKTITKTEGITHISENLVFDRYSGNPVVTRSYDDFNKTYITQDFMGSWYYDNLGSKYENEGLIVSNLTVYADNNTTFIYLNGSNCSDLAKFTEGDLLQLIYPNNTDVLLYHIDKIDRETFRLILSKSSLTQSGKDAYTFGINAKIIRSGRTNQLDTKVGNLIAHNSNGPILNTITPPNKTNTEVTSFLTLLNTKFSSFYVAPNTSSFASSVIKASELPTNLQIVDPQTGNCVKASELGFDIELSKKRKFSGKFNFDKDNSYDFYQYNNYIKLVKNSNSSYANTQYGNYILKGNARNNFYECNNCYTLTGAGTTSVPAQSSSIWYKNKIDLSQNFEYDYKAYFGNSDLGADGMTFVFHNDPTLPVGSHGGTLGIMKYNLLTGGAVSSVTKAFNGPVLGVEFDTYVNGYDNLNGSFENGVNICGTPTFDYSFNDWPTTYTVPICFNGNVNCHPSPANPISTYNNCVDYDFDHVNIFKDELSNSYPNTTDKPVAMLPKTTNNASGFPSENIEDGTYHDIKIKWTPTQNLFEVYIDGNLRKSFSKNIISDIFGNNNMVYFGVTGSQYLQSNQKVILPETFTGTECENCGQENLCNSTFKGYSGTFSFNEATGNILFTQTNTSCPQTISCFKLCTTPNPQFPSTGNIITASASVLSDYWTYNNSNYKSLTGLTTLNDFETGKRGKWRIKDQYLYRTATKDGYNFEAGTLTDFTPFNWKFENDDDFSLVNNSEKWILSSRINYYSPNGQALEDQNALGIKSTAAFKDNNTLLSAVAQNASYNSILFEDFEEAGTITSSHTGNKAKVISNAGVDYNIGDILVSENKLIVRTWVKGLSKTSSNTLYAKMNGTAIKMNFISSANDWHLYEATFDNLTVGNTLTLTLNANTTGIIVDDIRIQPYSSEMSCYVYDKAQRIIASFDDRHYALIYQYNSEGLLIRKLKETTQGLKTLSEQQYNSRKTNR